MAVDGGGDDDEAGGGGGAEATADVLLLLSAGAESTRHRHLTGPPRNTVRKDFFRVLRIDRPLRGVWKKTAGSSRVCPLLSLLLPPVADISCFPFGNEVVFAVRGA